MSRESTSYGSDYITGLRAQMLRYGQRRTAKEGAALDEEALSGDQEMIWGPDGDLDRAARPLLAETGVTADPAAEAQPDKSIITDKGEI